MLPKLIAFTLLAAILGVHAGSDEDTCYSREACYVYPSERPKGSHTLQYTKAVISKPAPVFEGTAVINGAFKQISLKDFLGKYVVFFFYPLDFTFVCPTEILAFSDRIEEFKNINTEVIACSVDSHFTHLAWTKVRFCSFIHSMFQ